MPTLSCDDRTGGEILVEFFGPFRKYGKKADISCSSDLSFPELVKVIEQSVGQGFARRAMASNVTYILNDKIVSREKLGDTKVAPGDRVAFALLLGGG